jgi:hypothetical protein
VSIRNYNAWIKAARKAADKTGGLSLPAARKAYRKMAGRVGRPLKGVDVKKHPRIFKESIPVKSGGKRPIKRATPVREAMPKKSGGRKLQSSSGKNRAIGGAVGATSRRARMGGMGGGGGGDAEVGGGRDGGAGRRSITSIEDFMNLGDLDFESEDMEFASTAEYKKNA